VNSYLEELRQHGSQPSTVSRISSSTWTAKAAIIFPTGSPRIGRGISPSSAPTSACRVLRNRRRAREPDFAGGSARDTRAPRPSSQAMSELVLQVIPSQALAEPG
jgi:hypothetical protein